MGRLLPNPKLSMLKRNAFLIQCSDRIIRNTFKFRRIKTTIPDNPFVSKVYKTPLTDSSK